MRPYSSFAEPAGAISDDRREKLHNAFLDSNGLDLLAELEGVEGTIDAAKWALRWQTKLDDYMDAHAEGRA